jgi:NAD(P)-dependent dehydrogenase (short-subunit alcohol dehydrogenase family)
VNEPDRTVLITGVCGGIGSATAAAFREAGWRVIGTDLHEPAGHVRVDRFHLADVSRDGGVDELLGELELAVLDGLVNNAAVQLDAPLVGTTDEMWSLVMNTNVRAMFQLIRGLHGPLAARRGGIVNVSSVHAIATSANVAAYAISKGAVAALTRTAALELAFAGIRCNAVLPGAVMTPMLEAGLSRRPHGRGPQGNFDDLVARTPLGFVATPDQVAPSIVFLADARLSPYTTGQTLVIDGGATVHLSTE